LCGSSTPSTSSHSTSLIDGDTRESLQQEQRYRHRCM
jgi:hypothetical protein